MVKIDGNLVDDIDLLIISYITLKVLSSEEIDEKSIVFKYYVYVLLFKVGIKNVAGILPKELYTYMKGHDVLYNKCHEDGIDTIDINDKTIRTVLNDVNDIYFDGCDIKLDAPIGMDLDAYFEHIFKAYNKSFESIIHTVDCISDTLQTKLLKKDLADAVKIEDYRLAAKIKKQITKLEQL